MAELNMSRQTYIFCLVLGLLLLSISLTQVGGTEGTVYTAGGLTTLRKYTRIAATECTLVWQNKTVCQYQYGHYRNPSPNKICRTSYSYGGYDNCYFEVDINNKNLSGVYTLTYKMKNGTYGEDRFVVYLHTGKVPKNGAIQVIENENIYIRLQDPFETDSGRDCGILYPNGTYETLLNSSWKSPNYWGGTGECGFKIEGVNKSVTDQRASYMYGGNDNRFRLQMSSSEGEYTYADFFVNVIPLVNIGIGKMAVKEWRIGESGMLYITNRYLKYCEVWNPKNERVQRAQSCSYTQNIVTEADEGNWTYVLGFDGKLSEERVIQQVRVIKSGGLQVDVSTSDRFGDELNLLCSLSPQSVNDCRFTRPDGVALLPINSIGNADYSYFGNGLDRGDCGLTIHSVQEVDKGVWKCTVSVGSTQWSGFLNVLTEVTGLTVKARQTRVAARQGSPFSLSCSLQHALDYCWFRQPSGLPLNFGSFSRYVYDDTLQQGVCTITVRTANISVDSGEWTCNLGVRGSPEEDYALPITVGVSETDMVSLHKEVVYSEGSTVLKCYSVPLGIALEYCRFVRPDGKGFNVDPRNSNALLGRYKYEGDGLAKGECGLKIVSEINVDEDVGEWTCVAKLQGRNLEGYDTITLTAEDWTSAPHRAKNPFTTFHHRDTKRTSKESRQTTGRRIP